MTWSQQTRSFVSLLIILHFTTVLIVLSTNYLASDLQRQLSGFLAIYAQSLNLDPLGARYYLTQATDADDDQFIEVQLEGSDEIHRYPPRDANCFSANAKRQRMLARTLSFFAMNEDSEACAEVAKAVGTHVMKKNDSKRGVIRCWRHAARFMNAGSDSDDWAPDRFSLNYEANFWLHEGGTEVLKTSEKREVAPTE